HADVLHLWSKVPVDERAEERREQRRREAGEPGRALAPAVQQGYRDEKTDQDSRPDDHAPQADRVLERVDPQERPEGLRDLDALDGAVPEGRRDQRGEQRERREADQAETREPPQVRGEYGPGWPRRADPEMPDEPEVQRDRRGEQKRQQTHVGVVEAYEQRG